MKPIANDAKPDFPLFRYDYINGGSFQQNTLHGNIADLQDTPLRQRVMVDESHLNLPFHLWDQALSLPVVLGSDGMAGMYSSRGEVKAVNAAKAVGSNDRRVWAGLSLAVTPVNKENSRSARRSR
ncbi:MAG: alpha-hydroxy-acid oxidizing protein [Xanthobacteraceae bacterium]